MLNNTKKAEIELLIFNRVPKVGSQSMNVLLVQLAKYNNFEHSKNVYTGKETVFLNQLQQKNWVDDLITRPRPHFYNQHIAYINFTRFNMPKPIYMNLVRDPIERIVSWYYYYRADWRNTNLNARLGLSTSKPKSKEFMEMDFETCLITKQIQCIFEQGVTKNPVGDHRRQTVFFCGQNRTHCMPFNSVAAMQQAKRTVEEEYAVVGTWEHTNITLTVLEYYIPRFFHKAKEIYYIEKKRLSTVNKNPDKKPISRMTREILRKNLTNEIEFYEFCKQRLYLQYAAIKTLANDDDYSISFTSEEEFEEKN